MGNIKVRLGKQHMNCHDSCRLFSLKGALSSLRKFWATRSPLKMMKSDFYFT